MSASPLPESTTVCVAGCGPAGAVLGLMLALADFTHLPGHFQYLSMVPQWDFLSFITGEAKHYPTFALCTETEAVGLIEHDGVVRGVRYRTGGDGREHELRALLTVAA